MKYPALSACLILCTTPLLAAQPALGGAEHLSLQNEVDLGISRGLAFLKAQQKPEGFWSNEEHPALTALPLMAFERNPVRKTTEPDPEFLQRGYQFLRSKAQPDGGIYVHGLSNYNTSLALMALLHTGLPGDDALAAKARNFIVRQQAAGMANPELDGGIGYGPTGVSPKRQHPDLDNTLVALEALRFYETARPNAEATSKDGLDWEAAIGFLSRTQPRPATNPKGSSTETDKGGFVYYPGFSNADPADGPRALRSYGSMTYAGLLSFVYADLKKDDPRVVAAVEWLSKNYSLEENPGLGQAGLYYYYHLMSKGLSAAGVTELQLASGKTTAWAPALARKILDLQKGDGSWANDTGRWMEKDPVLVTSYCVLTLELVRGRN